jgi:hypothetical protein
MSAPAPAVRWRTPDEAVREALEQEVTDLRACLRQWLALDPTFMSDDVAFIQKLADKGDRLAPVVVRTRVLLGSFGH